MNHTPTDRLGEFKGNNLYIKREDLIPYCFGGNKARKAFLFFNEIDRGGYDYVVTYGSSHSNHCRIVANMAAQRGLPCLLIGPEEVSEDTFNKKLVKLMGGEFIMVPVDQVHDTIEAQLERLRNEGYHPYFIEGGGHGNIGTEAYVECYQEIREYEAECGVNFDYIFFASGTGTTQAGLVCGKLINGDKTEIIGISIARKNPRGRNVVVDSVRSYLGDRVSEDAIQDAVIFLDDYIGRGYGTDERPVKNVINEVLVRYGIPMDETYTGKAFMGMEKFIEEKGITGKNILFIHTGGAPLFFDLL